MQEQEIVRIAVRATMAAMGAMVAAIVVLFLLAAVVSPTINVPGVHVPKTSSIGGRPSGD